MKFINQFKKWLNRPYSYREEIEFQISVSFIIGFIVFLILYTLKPFGLDEVDNNIVYYFGGYGIISTIVILLFFFIVDPLFPNFFSDANWTVKREIITLSSIILVIGFMGWVYHKNVAYGNINHDRFTFLYFLKYAFSIGVFPLIIYVYLSEMFLRNNRKNTSKKVKKFIKKYNFKLTNKYTKKVTFSGANNKLVIALNDIVYVKSDGNYVIFYIKDKDVHMVEKILRLQLLYVEKKLSNYSHIIRCHKSYIVNSNYVNDISGNARAHYLHLSIASNKIPVSRKFTKNMLVELIS